MLQQFDLAQRALGENLLTEDIGDLFDSNAFVGLVVNGSTIVASLPHAGNWRLAWRGRSRT